MSEPSTDTLEILPVISTLQRLMRQSGPFVRLRERLGSIEPAGPIPITGVEGSLLAFIAAFLYEEGGTQLLVVVPERDRAEQLRDDCALLAGEQHVRLYAPGQGHKAHLLDMTEPIAQAETLRALTRAERVLVVSSAEAFAGRVPSPASFTRRTLELQAGSEYPFEQLLERLIALGFERKDFVEEYGDFAVRGGILDVFPFIGEHPIRLEFWGDTIESIREFDVLSQRSLRNLSVTTIVASLAGGSSPPGTGDEHRGDFTASSPSSILEYLIPDALILVDQPELIRKEIDELLYEGVKNVFDWPGLQERLQLYRRVEHSSFSQRKGDGPIDFESAAQPGFHGSVKTLVQQLHSLSKDGLTTYLLCDTRDEVERLRELLDEELAALGEGAPNFVHERLAHPQGSAGPAQVFEEGRAGEMVDPDGAPISGEQLSYRLIPEALHRGFTYAPAKIALYTEHEVFGRLKRRGVNRRRRFRGLSQKELRQLRRGDYVVHVDYGIGRFTGLQKITVRGAEQEVMKVVYAEGDVLYVNLNFVNRVQKYTSQEGHVPALTKLGAPDWERLKARARRKIRDIARDLIRLYARRKTEQGFSFAPDTHWQKEMEASFMYEDTPDQATTTSDVKRDMELPAPMDRLVCGDVGFGKTEVAVRAAFKAVMSGKQVAVLVPTTILAQQHLNTFLDRLGRYSVQIESLTRFKAKQDQARVLRLLADGRIDIIIGTHRLLSKDVVFRDLGLLVIDEEHRFGVSAKEKLRQLRASVDTLTLTATPIPRTLQFSLMGARDLSLISTPPRNRLPIVTEIAEYDIALIREAILRELHRGGQIYFVHDRVSDIEEVRQRLQQVVPESRFRTAHGQMRGHELEQAMIDFLDKKFDVLVCTKIVESGIDIPSVNTIIVNRADRFGLAELYQLRGRVGRSNEQAYAYLLIPPISSLPRAALRRLQALQEFTELGSGFNLAVRDLEIRGAGNLLGAEQSGFILELGFEMYQRVVEEAVAELKRQEFQGIFGSETGDRAGQKPETIVETDIEALIPDFYVESDTERLDFYRRLYRAGTQEEIREMRTELKDRFGEYPDEVEHLFLIVELKLAAAAIGFVKVDLHKDRLTLFFPPPENLAFYEGTNGRVATFQQIVSRIPVLRKHRPELKQEGKRLKLVAEIAKQEPARREASPSAVRLWSARQFLEALAPDSGEPELRDERT